MYPIASLTRKNESDALPLHSSAVEKVASKHPNDKILVVHTVSYKLTDHLLKVLNSSGFAR